MHYQWKYTQTEKFEDKVAYVFTVEPFDWIIGTSASVKALQEAPKNEVIYRAETIRYARDNYFYFFITSYDITPRSLGIYQKNLFSLTSWSRSSEGIEQLN